MPLSDSPDQKVIYYLSTDYHKPKDKRPAFVCKSYTRKQSREKREKIAEARKAETVDEAYERYLDIIMEGVVDWRNVNGADGQPLPFTRENVDAKLADQELKELAERFDQFDEVDARSF